MTKPYPIDPNDPSTYVTCKLCGRKSRVITAGHMKLHGETLENYKELFPESPLVSQNVLDRNRENTLKRWSEPVYREKMEKSLVNTRKAFLSDPEKVKQRNSAIAKAHTGRVMNAAELAAKQANGRAFMKKAWSQEHPFPNRQHPAQTSPEWLAGRKAHMDRIRPTPEQASERMSKLIREKKIKPHYYSVPTTYKGIEMRSQAEAAFASRLDALELSWEYEPGVYQLENGKKYIPDFYIPALDMYIEIKGYDNGKNTHKAKLFNAEVVLAKHIGLWPELPN